MSPGPCLSSLKLIPPDYSWQTLLLEHQPTLSAPEPSHLLFPLVGMIFIQMAFLTPSPHLCTQVLSFSGGLPNRPIKNSNTPNAILSTSHPS